jgi:hypothetical protein
MTRKPFDSEPELLRQLAAEPVPSSPEDAAPARRERIVLAMKDAVERSAELTEKRRRVRRWAYGLAIAASFVLASGLLLRDRVGHSGAPPSIAGIDQVAGTVVLTQDGTRRVLTGGERSVHDGDAVQTAAGAQARLATSKASVDISESTELRVSRPSTAEERISLRRGRVDVAVDKAVETKRAVVVETPDAEVVVRGTVFDVRVEPARGATTTHVHVTRGSVWVLSQGVQVALLSAGQSWSSAGGVAAAAPALLPLTSAPVKAVEPAPAIQPVKPAAAGTGIGKEATARKSGTLTEENRLFSAGVEARNRGDAARAAELFGELLSQYPQSALREVAQVERFRALSRAGQATRAATEARRYLAEHSDGSARAEARELALDPKK